MYPFQSSTPCEAKESIKVEFGRWEPTEMGFLLVAASKALHPGRGRMTGPLHSIAGAGQPDLNNHRGWFCEQGHRGFKGEKGEPGLPGLDGLDAPCPLVWCHPLPAWPVWTSPCVRFMPACLSSHPPHPSCSIHPGSTSCLFSL